jgi:hypothetical protein
MTKRTETTRTTTTDQDVVEEKSRDAVIINGSDVTVVEGETTQRPVNERRTATETVTRTTEGD